MKYGVSINLDVTKIAKEHLYAGQKGKYLSAVVFIDVDSKDQHGNNGMVVQDWKDAPKGQTPILGNVKVFWSDGQQQAPKQQQRPATSQPAQSGQQGNYNNAPDDEFDSEIPF